MFGAVNVESRFAKEFATNRNHKIEEVANSRPRGGYLLATTFDYENVVYYALHRIHTAELIDEPAKRPRSFSLDAFLAEGRGQFGDGKTISLKATLTDNLAAILRETALSPDQKITTRAGKNTLTATVKDSWQLHFWIRSQVPYLTVIQPASLRKNIVSQLKSALANYSPANTAKP